MARSNFLGGAYTLRSVPLAAQTCIGLYFEPSEVEQGKGAFLGTPGLLRKVSFPKNRCRGLLAAGGKAWAVYGNGVYRFDTYFNPVFVGNLPNDDGACQLVANVDHLLVAHQNGWHSVNLTSSAFAEVTNAPTMSDASFIDNYLVGAKEDGTYVWAAVNGITIDPLNFASAEGNPDKIIRTLADHRELWLFGATSVEVAVVTSDPDLPFTRTSYIEQGILAPKSAAKEDNSVFWLGRNDSGQGVVYVAEGYIPRRVSTFAIEQAIEGYANPEQATAYTYQQDGHHFYVLNFAEATWAFDINTQIWHQRAYRDTSTGELTRHRGESHCFFGGMHLVGDYVDSRLFALDLDTFTDDGDPIYRERAWHGQEAENRWVTYNRGELIGEMGVGNGGRVSFFDALLDELGDEILDEGGEIIDADNPTDPGADPMVYLQWSDDAVAWGSAHPRRLGKIGERTNRAIWRRMGRSRRRYYKLWTSEPVRIAWYGFNYDTEVSNG
ncbi:hypothetical protein [Lysobacter panacisoli]|uniref:Phage stabilisation protein n=1 Tax=Lysobacter panacisoli TaxID=1255263 RepID=A0ABP9LCH1_9GAMM|nr:hypothetical protein [Lysobacter panacisoli]